MLVVLTNFCRRYLGLGLILLALVILRVPNFFEPYWYGDEAIYLTIGNAMNQGEKLYTEIVDHKTPLIYYLARVPDQISFRWLNLGWMLVTTVLFYGLAQKLFQKTWLSTLVTAVFMVLTTVPWFEGNIPNGELFVMGFVLAGFTILSRTQIWHQFLTGKTEIKNLTKPQELMTLLVAGVFIGLGILTKVPALLDLGAGLLIFWFLVVRLLWQAQPKILAVIQKLIPAGLAFLSGVILPILASIGYFISRGSGADYLQFGLLYNLHYTQTWKQDYGSVFLNWAFTLPGKTILLVVVILGLSMLSKKLKPSAQFALAWFAAALFAVLLSNRPYPHYFIQLVPAAALLLGVALDGFTELFNFKNLIRGSLSLGLSLAAFWLVTAIMFKLNAGLYDTKIYYQKFWNLMVGKITRVDYNHSFDSLVAENELVAADLAVIKPHRMFIWGTNPTLYAQTKIVPAGRFTVAFHIQDLKVYDQTLREIVTTAPEVIIVMKNETQSFPTLNDYIAKYYQVAKTYPRMTLYRLRI